MNKYSILLLKTIRKLYTKCRNNFGEHCLSYETNPDIVSERIFNLLSNDNPCMIARLGGTELNAMANYLGVSQYRNSYLSFIKHRTPAWWWESYVKNNMMIYSGFFPISEASLTKFAKMMIEDCALVDILGSWRAEELYFQKELRNTYKVGLSLLEPWWADKPWTRILTGKNVLVVHPFADSIWQQYHYKREKLFRNDSILPVFNLKVLKAVQSLGGNSNYNDWFEALEYMKKEIDKVDYDICLIGCGAYGFPLAAHVKRTGKKAIHLGGGLQLLFGIRGKRWDMRDEYKSLMNEYLIRPSEDETPVVAKKVEGACYW